jgi:membrane protease YdiL (CAAX protease family)
MDEEPEQMRQALSVEMVTIFYAILTGLAWFLASLFEDFSLWTWNPNTEISLYVDVALGVVSGLLVVGASQLLESFAGWARRLGREFGKMLGEIKVWQAFIFAALSGLGEELFFRGFVQQLLSTVIWTGEPGAWFGLVAASLIFGLIHMGPDIEIFWPWTLMAVLLGGVFGGMYLYTGRVLAPILSHFTINFFNLYLIGQKYGHLGPEGK